MSLTFNTYKHTDLLGALVRYSVPSDCSISLDKLVQRMFDAKFPEFSPTKRHRADALRLAVSEVSKKSRSVDDNGNIETLVIANLERKPGATTQEWAVHRQIKDRNNQSVYYQYEGSISLHDEGYVSYPPILPDMYELVAKYEMVADHTKIRECIKKIVQFCGEPIPLNGLFFVSQSRIELLRSVLTEVFGELDEGKVAVSIYEIAATVGNAQSLAQEMKESIDSELSKIELGIAKAREENANLTKGVVAEWLSTIATLKANMTEMGVVNVTLPANLSEMEAKLQELKVEMSKPKSKRVLAAI